MQAKPVTQFYIAVALLTAGPMFHCTVANAQDEAKAPPPVQIALFDTPASYGDSVPKAIVQTRDSLRKNAALEVLLFNPDSPTFIRAAKSAVPPIALSDLSSPAQQPAVATAVGASYYVVLALADRDRQLTATIINTATGSQESIDKPESPDAMASDITNHISSWPPPVAIPTLSLPAVQVPAAAVEPQKPAAPLTVPVIVKAPAVIQSSADAVSSADMKPVITPEAVPPANTSVTAAVPEKTDVIAPEPATVIAPPQNVPVPLLSPGQPATIVSPTLDTSALTPKVVATQPIVSTAVSGSSPAIPGAQVDAAQPATPTVTAVPNTSAIQTPTPTTPLAVAPLPVTIPTSPVPQEPVTNSVTINNGLPTATQVPVPVVVPSDAIVPTKTISPANSPITTGPSVTISAVTIGNPGTSQSVLLPSEPAVSVPAVQIDPALSDEAKRAMDAGDGALQTSDPLTAIGDYRKAVSLSPRASSPRLKLAQAYLQAGMKDKSSEEARRALAIDPGNTDVQTFIRSQDDGPGASGDVVIAQAQTESDPNNPTAWIALGDAYWNVSDPDDALISYRRAADIDSSGIVPQTRLAKLYAARAQYDESLAALKRSGADGYPFALKIISSRSESLVGDIDDETQALIKGTDTREQFYAKIKSTDTQARGLADFVSKIVPPDHYKVSQLHRELSTRLLAQTTATWIDYAETSNSDDKNQAADLEKHAVDEMQTASVAEDLQSRIMP